MGRADIAMKIRRGEGPVFRPIKSLARKVLAFHLPVLGPAKPFFGLLYRFHVLMRELWIWSLRFFWFEPLFRSQCCSVGEQFQMERLPYLTGRGGIVIGSRVRLSGKSSIAFTNRGQETPQLRIGNGSFIGHDCRFAVTRSITIGNDCLLAAGVQVQDHDGHPLDAARRRAGEPVPPDAMRPVMIGDDVWIGSGAVILKGVTIGDRAIVGARAVVTRDVPADAVVAGNPARIVKNLGAEGIETPQAQPGAAPD